MLKKLAVLILGVMVLALGASATTVLSVGSYSTLQPPGSATIDVTISGASNLYGYQFDILYDSSILTLTGVSEGAFLAGGGATDFFSDTSVAGDGFVLATLLGNVSGVSGSGTLFSLTFTGAGIGTSGVTLDGVYLIADDLSQITDFTVNAGSVTVPEPASMALMATGLLGLVGAIRRKKSA